MNGSRSALVAALGAVAALTAGGSAWAQAGSFPLANTNQSEVSIAAAWDGARYLVGIQGDAASKSNVVARFVTPAGNVSALISTGRTGGAPHVAWGGGKHLLVWEDDNLNPDDQLYAMLIDPSGTHGAPFPISHKPGEERPAGVAYAGGQFLVAYSLGTALYARQVSPGGVVGPELTLTSASYAGYDVDTVASNGSSYLVVWTDDANRSMVTARIVQLDGTLGPLIVVDASPERSDDPLAVGTDGTNYLVVWGDQLPAPSGEEWDLFGRVVAPDGSLLGGPFQVSGAPGHQFGPFVACDGSRYLVTWSDLSNDANGNWQCDPGEDTCWDIAGRHFLPDGTPLGAEWTIVADAGDQYASPVAFGAGQYLLVWTDGDWVAEGGDVWATFLPPGPVAQVYCTAKVNSQGCTPAIGFSGVPSVTSADPFLVTASAVINNVFGILFYGKSGPASTPFQGGTLCVQPPVLRCPVQLSGGNPPPEDCSGTFAIDFNAYAQSGADPLLVAGLQVNAQYWYRDPNSPSTTGLTDALRLVLGP